MIHGKSLDLTSFENGSKIGESIPTPDLPPTASRNIIQGNSLGLQAAPKDLTEGTIMITSGASDNTVDSNGIFGGKRGVLIRSNSNGNRVLGNAIAHTFRRGVPVPVVLDPKPSKRLPYSEYWKGVEICSSSDNLVESNTIEGLGVGVSVGSCPEEPATLALRNRIQGNVIGPDNGAGVGLVHGSQETLVGGKEQLDGNLIAANKFGIVVNGDLSNLPPESTVCSGNQILGNLVLNNNFAMDFGLSNDTLVEDNAVEGNLRGLRVGSWGKRVSILSNIIAGNYGPEIDLSPWGVDQNDPGDGDGGANEGQNHPEITGVVQGSRVVGSLESIPGEEFLLQIFASPSCDEDSGAGMGVRPLVTERGQTRDETDREPGIWRFDVPLPELLPDGTAVSATATHLGQGGMGSTSEFSPCFVVGDVDRDGLPDVLEEIAPNGGDGNGDGLPDQAQGRVASLPNAIDQSFVTLEAPVGIELVNVQAFKQPLTQKDAPDEVSFPIGFLGFVLQGLIPGGGARPSRSFYLLT